MLLARAANIDSHQNLLEGAHPTLMKLQDVATHILHSPTGQPDLSPSDDLCSCKWVPQLGLLITHAKSNILRLAASTQSVLLVQRKPNAHQPTVISRHTDQHDSGIQRRLEHGTLWWRLHKNARNGHGLYPRLCRTRKIHGPFIHYITLPRIGREENAHCHAMVAMVETTKSWFSQCRKSLLVLVKCEAIHLYQRPFPTHTLGLWNRCTFQKAHEPSRL